MSSFFNELTIENFGPIKKASVEVKDMLVFIGPQASGKSTLAKLITILNDINFKQQPNARLVEELEKYNIHTFLKSNTIIKFHTPSFSFEYKNNEQYKFDIYDIINRIDNSTNKSANPENRIKVISGTIDIMLLGIVLDEKENILLRELQKLENYGLNSNLENLFKILPEDRKYTTKIFKVYNKNILDEAEYINLLEVVKQVFSLIRPLDSLYIPAERTLLPLLAPNIAGLTNTKILIPQNILVAVQQFQNAIQKISDLNLDIIGSLKF
jgi:predicted ATPase